MKQKQNVVEHNKSEACAMTKDQMIELMEKINRGRKDNLESRRSALNTLVGAFPVGGKVFAVVALDELHIDESYQRPLQNHVKIIARDWNPTKCDPLKINFREDGNLYVWDGQHRLEAARLRGIKYLLCDITVGLTQDRKQNCLVVKEWELRSLIRMIFSKLMYVLARKLTQLSRTCVISMIWLSIEIIRKLEIYHVLHL